MTIPSLLLSLCVAVALGGLDADPRGARGEVAIGRRDRLRRCVIGWRAPGTTSGDFSDARRPGRLRRGPAPAARARSLDDPRRRRRRCSAAARSRCRRTRRSRSCATETGLPKEAIQASIQQERPPAHGVQLASRGRSTSSPAPAARSPSAAARDGRASRGRTRRRPASSGSRAQRPLGGRDARCPVEARRRTAVIRTDSDAPRRWRSPPTPTPLFLARASSSPSAGAGASARTRSSARSSSRTARSSARASTPTTAAHAEVEALAACPATRAAATLYVSLEPCCHHGQTPPCTDAIVAAGIARVVVASDDPTEKASGRGLGILRDEGVEVVVADGELAARAAAQPAVPQARAHRPPARAVQVGDVARRQGRDPDRRLEVDLRRGSRGRPHRWRAECDAVVVGIGTALADDPQLTARVDGVARQPRRVVFDSTAGCRSTPSSSRDAPEMPLTVVVSRAAPRLRPTRWRPPAPRSSSPPARTSPRGCARRSTSSARAASPRSCSRAARTWPARSSTRVRSTRCGCSSPVVLGGRRPRPARGRGRRADRRGDARADAGLRARRRATCCLRAGCGSGDAMFTGLVADLGTVDAVDATGDGCARASHAAGRRAGRGRLGRRQRRLPDRDRVDDGASRPT